MADFPPQIQKRIDAGIGCGSDIPDGWLQIIIDLDAKLSKLHPDYTIDQIKEKFGSLRYYTDGVDKEGRDLINDAEYLSSQTCLYCGEPGKNATSSMGWRVTSCEKHLNGE